MLADGNGTALLSRRVLSLPFMRGIRFGIRVSTHPPACTRSVSCKKNHQRTYFPESRLHCSSDSFLLSVSETPDLRSRRGKWSSSALKDNQRRTLIVPGRLLVQTFRGEKG